MGVSLIMIRLCVFLGLCAVLASAQHTSSYYPYGPVGYQPHEPHHSYQPQPQPYYSSHPPKREKKLLGALAMGALAVKGALALGTQVVGAAIQVPLATTSSVVAPKPAPTPAPTPEPTPAPTPATVTKYVYVTPKPYTYKKQKKYGPKHKKYGPKHKRYAQSMIAMALGMTNMDLFITDMALSIVKGIMAQSMMTRNMIHMALIRGKATLLNMTEAMTLPIHMAQQLHHIK